MKNQKEKKKLDRLITQIPKVNKEKIMIFLKDRININKLIPVVISMDNS